MYCVPVMFLKMKNARIRIIKHEAIPGSGSFEVRFADGRESQYFYFDDGNVGPRDRAG